MVAVVTALALVALTGCPPQGPGVQVFDPLPMPEAIAKVNANSARIGGTVKAVAGHARGVFTDENGKPHRFDLDANLLVRPPRCMRLDLKSLLESQMVIGSNRQKYWVVQTAAKALSYGRHDTMEVPGARELIIRPDLFVEALGLGGLPAESTGSNEPVQRVTANYQQLCYLEYDENGVSYIAKEYWISRRDPRLVERIVFRDRNGEVALDAQLDKYRRIEKDGPFIAHRIRLTAPETGNWLEFTALGWKPMPQVDETHPAFVFPLDRGESFERVVDLDVELDQLHHPFTEEERIKQLVTPLRNSED